LFTYAKVGGKLQKKLPKSHPSWEVNTHQLAPYRIRNEGKPNFRQNLV